MWDENNKIETKELNRISKGDREWKFALGWNIKKYKKYACIKNKKINLIIIKIKFIGIKFKKINNGKCC
jgi:hypothetical protein